MALGDLNLVVSAQVSGATQGLKQVDQSLQRVQGSMARANQATRAMTNQFNSSRSRLQKFATGAMQQAGYQIGDFAVQVANGTSKMQAFGQQGSQLLGIFGPIGAVLGAGVAIFSAFGVAASRSGTSVGEFGAALGVLQEPLTAVARAVKSMAGNFSGAMQIILQNIDTALIAAGLFATYMAGKYVASIAIATASTITFQGAMYAMGVAVARVQMILARFLPFAIIIGMAKMVEMFLQLRKGAGGFGEAMALVGDLFGAVVESWSKKLEISVLKMKISFEGFRKSIFEVLLAVSEKFDEFLDNFVAKWNDTVGAATPALKLEIGWSMADQIRGSLTEINESIKQYNEQIDNIGEPSAGVQKAWEALKAAFNAGGQEIKLFGDATEEAAGRATAAVQKIEDRFQSLKDSIRSSMEDAFMSMVDGTKTVPQAFKAMASEIIKELYRVLVVQRLVAQISSFLGMNQISGSWFGPGSGANYAPPSRPIGLGARARGGPITAGKPYMVGERGPELIVPSRNASVIPNNQLSSGGVTVIQNNTFGNGVSRAEIQAMLPRLVETTKAAVFDAQRRSVNGLGYA